MLDLIVNDRPNPLIDAILDKNNDGTLRNSAVGTSSDLDDLLILYIKKDVDNSSPTSESIDPYVPLYFFNLSISKLSVSNNKIHGFS